MKNRICIVVFWCSLFLCSCKKDEKTTTEPTIEIEPTVALGKEIFEGKGNCLSCHQENTSVIAPSIKEITKIYNEKNAKISLFLAGELEPIVQPEQYTIMKTNLELTKTFDVNELEALEMYMNSVK